MTNEKMCVVCSKREATEVCEKCGVPLCYECIRTVSIERADPGQRIMGVSTSALKPAERKWKVCEKCMKEEEFF